MTNRFRFRATELALATILAATAQNTSLGTEPSSFTTSTPTAVDSVSGNAPTAVPAVTTKTQSNAGTVEMVNRVIASLALGPAFDAKVRQRVWTSDREMVGVGTYEQAGRGSGQFNLQLTMHDGDGKHTLQQISDGRLAWTRSEVASQIKLKRVDVGRLGEWTSHLENKSSVSPRLRIGAWTEMLDMISRDYVLRLAAGTLESQTVWILSGTLREELRDDLTKTSNRSEWPPLYPTHVRVAIAAKPLNSSGFGEGLPVRMEFFADPVTSVESNPETSSREVGPMITLVELYSIRPIDPPPVARFRFENQHSDVNFVNETDRYLELYGIQLSESDRKRMRR